MRLFAAKMRVRTNFFAKDCTFDHGNEFFIKKYAKMTPMNIEQPFELKCLYEIGNARKCLKVRKYARASCTWLHFLLLEWIPQEKLPKNDTH